MTSAPLEDLLVCAKILLYEIGRRAWPAYLAQMCHQYSIFKSSIFICTVEILAGMASAFETWPSLMLLISYRKLSWHSSKALLWSCGKLCTLLLPGQVMLRGPDGRKIYLTHYREGQMWKILSGDEVNGCDTHIWKAIVVVNDKLAVGHRFLPNVPMMMQRSSVIALI